MSTSSDAGSDQESNVPSVSLPGDKWSRVRYEKGTAHVIKKVLHGIFEKMSRT
jgi:hypothetical protein